jgi:GxxExxY protein
VTAIDITPSSPAKTLATNSTNSTKKFGSKIDAAVRVVMEKILYKELAYKIVGAALEVHRILGSGFLEAIYEQALAYELGLRQISFERQAPIGVSYKGRELGEYRAGFVVDKKIVLEIKAVSVLVAAHESQAHHYLAATCIRLAILLNFGASSLQFKRIIR